MSDYATNVPQSISPHGGTIRETLRLLKEDLQKQFALSGNPKKTAGLLQLIIRSPHPRFLPLVFCRFSRLSLLMGIPFLSYVFSYLNLLLFGLQITPRCEIGGGFFLPHPSGTVIGAWRIGRNVTVFQQVTLGAKTADMHFTIALLPEICSNVIIGAGAKVLGGIRLADGVIVGANAVVLDSVGPNSTVVGIPARKITVRDRAIDASR